MDRKHKIASDKNISTRCSLSHCAPLDGTAMLSGYYEEAQVSNNLTLFGFFFPLWRGGSCLEYMQANQKLLQDVSAIADVC